MRHESLTSLESIIIGFIIGVTSPSNTFGGISSWQWWVYIILMNIIVNMAYGVGKAWWLDRHIRKACINENKA